MARLRRPKCEHCKQTIRAPRQPKEKPLPAVVDAAWLASGASPGERWGRHLASFRPGGIEAWEQARAICHKVLMEARELFGPYATYGNGSGPCWVGAMKPHGGAVGIGHGATLEDALADAWMKVKSGQALVKQVERWTADLLFAGVEVEWPHGEPAIPKFDTPEEEPRGKSDIYSLHRWLNKHLNASCLTGDEAQRVFERFMALHGELDESAIMEEKEELDPAEAFAREQDDDELPEEPSEEATPEDEAPVIPDEDMDAYGKSDLDLAEVYAELTPV